LTLRTEMYMDFAARLEQAMTAKSIKLSPTVLANLFNAEFDGKSSDDTHSKKLDAGKAMPTQDKLMCLAKLLGTSAEQLRYGRYSEKTLMIKQS
jgi:hypothetical protein